MFFSSGLGSKTLHHRSFTQLGGAGREETSIGRAGGLRVDRRACSTPFAATSPCSHLTGTGGCRDVAAVEARALSQVNQIRWVYMIRYGLSTRTGYRYRYIVDKTR